MVILAQVHSLSSFGCETRLEKIPNLTNDYDKVIPEYDDLGHMEIVPSPRNTMVNPHHYYLPYHAVFKPESSNTNLRVVFNASSPSANGKI